MICAPAYALLVTAYAFYLLVTYWMDKYIGKSNYPDLMSSPAAECEAA